MGKSYTDEELLEWLEWLDGRGLVITEKKNIKHEINGLTEAPKKRKEYKVVVSIDLEYRTLASNIEEAKIIAENMELPKEYIEDSFEIKSITPEV